MSQLSNLILKLRPSNAAQKKTREAGFTLVEVMTVLAIIALTTTFVVMNVIPRQNEAKVKKAKGDIRILEQALELYRLDMGDYPSEANGLDALTSAPSDLERPELYPMGGYVKLLPSDPWGTPYVYKYPGDHGVFDIMSYGSDGQEGGEELARDITSWEP